MAHGLVPLHFTMLITGIRMKFTDKDWDSVFKWTIITDLAVVIFLTMLKATDVIG